jgi:hypothetical protein
MAEIRFCTKTADLRAKIYDGRHEQARSEAVALLREGFATRPFLDLVAELLDPPARGKGQPKRPPQRWLEIGERFREERDNGHTREKTIALLAEEFGASEGTIRRAHEFYEAACDESREINLTAK